MSRKLHPLAIAFRAADALSDDEKLALRDYLRPAPKPRSKSKSERKPSQKRKAGKEATAKNISDHDVEPCQRPDCHFDRDHNVHHITSDPEYHQFVEPAGEASKGVGV